MSRDRPRPVVPAAGTTQEPWVRAGRVQARGEPGRQWSGVPAAASPGNCACPRCRGDSLSTAATSFIVPVGMIFPTPRRRRVVPLGDTLRHQFFTEAPVPDKDERAHSRGCLASGFSGASRSEASSGQARSARRAMGLWAYEIDASETGARERAEGEGMRASHPAEQRRCAVLYERALCRVAGTSTAYPAHVVSSFDASWFRRTVRRLLH
jgi:hypothetical protein